MPARLYLDCWLSFYYWIQAIILMQSLAQTYRLLLEAASFAAKAHHGQTRKDKTTPYVSHVFRVCLVVRDLFGFDDPRMLPCGRPPGLR